MTNTANFSSAGEQSADTWRALRVTVPADRLEPLLTTAVDAWAAEARGTGGLGGWYFERPGADGTVLDLRLRGAGRHAIDDLRRRVAAFGAGAPGAITVEEHAPGSDAARFGGVHGMAACAPHLAAAGALAVETLRETPSPATRLLAAGELLLASAWAMGADWLTTIGWLRGYTCGRARTAEAARARDAAETAYFRDEATWRHHHDRVRAEISAPNSRAGAWYVPQCAAWAALRRLHRAGRLDGTPEAAFRALARSACNRLGLTPEEEIRVAWLWSMTLVAPGPRRPFFADTAASPDRRLHEESKYFADRLPVQVPDMAAGSAGGRQDVGTPQEVVRLPEPAAPDAAAPLEEVLLARRSAYGRYRGPFTSAELGTLLYYSAAETAGKTMAGAESAQRVRTYPSGGTRYPLRLLAYCHDVEGLRRGMYLYDPAAHALGRLVDGDLSAGLMRMAPATDPRVPSPPKAGGNIDAADCPLWILMVADLTYQRRHYGLRSYRLVMQESGHLGQNIALVATWLGKASVGLGGFYDDTVNQVLGLDGVNSAVVYVHLVGTVEPDA